MTVYCYVLYTQYILKAAPMTWNLSKVNTWKTKEEPFWTNESFFNALICWVIWFLNISMLYILIFYAFLLVGIAVVFLFKKGPKQTLQQVYKWIKIFAAATWANIANKSQTEAIMIAMNIPIPLANEDNLSDSAVRAEFISNRKHTFINLDIHDREMCEGCTICLLEFENTDSVV